MYFRSLLVLLFALSSVNIWANIQIKNNHTQQLDAKITKQFAQLPHTHIGALVYDLDHNRLLYSANAVLGFIPASTLKLYTATAAYFTLGPDYRFKTDVYASRSVNKQGILAGSLYVKFTGDPMLTVQDLDHLIARLVKKGLRRVQGNIVVDVSAFDQEGVGPGWMWDDATTCFAAPVSAFNLNQNCFKAMVHATPVGHRVRVVITEPYHAIQWQTRARTKRGSHNSCQLILRAKGNHYTLSGCQPHRRRLQELDVAIQQPTRYGLHVLRALLKQHHIHYQQLVLGHLPKRYPVIASHASPNLTNLLMIMLKESNNLIANALFKKMGELATHRAGTWDNGQRALRVALEKKGFKNLPSVIVDGSGTSRYNIVEPQQLLALLQYIAHHAKLTKVLEPALPIGGVDGTLTHRLHAPAVRGVVHAKTGGMQGVANLAGYLLTQSKRYIIVFMMNDVVGHNQHAHRIQDRICAYLASRSSAA